VRSGQNDTYSVAFGEERINEIRSISKVTGLQQAEIVRHLWDTYKKSAVEELLAGKEQSLEGKLADIKGLLEELTAPGDSEIVKDVKEPAPAEPEEDADESFEDDEEEEYEEDPNDFDTAAF
jgi:hypothetical protein